MKRYINTFAKQIRAAKTIDELIKVESFCVDNEHIGYLYAYKTERGVHVETSASVGDCTFTNWDDMYCGHTLHEYLDADSINDTTVTLEDRIERLLNKTIAQLDILAPIERHNALKSGGTLL